MAELIIAASPGFGHIEPSVRLATYYLSERNVRVMLILPAATGSPLPDVPGNCDGLQIVRVDLPADCAAPIAGAGSMIERKDDIVSDLISANNLAERKISAVIYDMLSAQWCIKLAETLRVPHYVFVPAHLALTYLSIRFPEYAKMKDALRVPNEHFEKAMSHLPPGLRIPPPMVGDIDIKVPGVRAPMTGSDLFEIPPLVWDVLVGSYLMFCRANGAIVQDLPSLYSDANALISAIETDQAAKAGNEGHRKGTGYKVYTTGALALFDKRPLPTGKTPEIEWLDKQRPSSVIFAASGSWCQISVADTVELARGIQLSKLPFLWAYRDRNDNLSFSEERALVEAADETGLPQGFREETRDAGMIVQWVNQAAVLRHPAIACFMTHCGWNSVMEALAWAGVPLVLLPLGADQGMNANLLENEWQCGKRVWDVSSHRRLERNSVANVVKDCATSTCMRERAQSIKRSLNDATAPNGHASLERHKFLASLTPEN